MHEYWRGRRVLVTGHTGFKGSWLTMLLGELGAEVHGLALDPVADELFCRAELESHLASDVRDDIRDAAAVQRAVATIRPEVLLHLAAQPLVLESYRDPVGTFSTNVLGTAHVLEAARRTAPTRVAIVVTTDKVYRNVERVEGYREDEPLGGDDPYSASKAAAELVAHSYATTLAGEDLAIATARAGNVIGGGDLADDRLLPDLVRSSWSGEAVRIRNPESVRPWQHVLDPLYGYLMLVEQMASTGRRGSWNFGPMPSERATVVEVAERAIRLLGPPASFVVDDAAGPHEAGLLSLDSAKALHDLGWRPELDLDEALQWTVGWWKDVGAGASAGEVTSKQVHAYLRRRAGAGAA